jgi:hypothetical protein
MTTKRNRDRHSPGYMRDYMRRRRAAQKLDDEDRDAPLNVYMILAAEAWQNAKQAAPKIPEIRERTQPPADAWKMLIKSTRKAADDWTRLAEQVEAMEPPATRRTKSLLGRQN